MKYIKTAIATNTDIDNSNVVIDLTGEECPKFVATGKKESIATSCWLPTIDLITPSSTPPPLLVEDPPKVMMTRNEFNQETVVLEGGIYVHYHYEGNN
jgi:hypothetical protein